MHRPAQETFASLRSHETGLTLIEVVVVALLMTILSALLYGTLSGIVRARESTENLRITDKTAHYIFSRLDSELSGRSFVPLNVLPNDGSSSPSPSTGPAYLSGDDGKNGEFEKDKIRFVSANAAQSFVEGSANFGLVEVEYRLEENSSGEDHFADGPKTFVLVRDEIPAATNSQDIAKKRKITVPVADNIVSLNFRYLKKGAWQNEWKDTNPPLPEIIEVSVVIRGTEGKTESYRSAFPMSAKPRQQNGSS